MTNSRINRCMKSVLIRSYCGPYFPAFGLNMKRYSVSLRIQSECGKIWTRITPNTVTFTRWMTSLVISAIHAVVTMTTLSFGTKSRIQNPIKISFHYTLPDYQFGQSILHRRYIRLSKGYSTGHDTIQAADEITRL